MVECATGGRELSRVYLALFKKSVPYIVDTV